MDSVVLNGVTYVKASVAAKALRYTSDYVGQLCRSKKVDARLVGRTWFVNLDSVKEYKKNKYKSDLETESSSSDKASEIKTHRGIKRLVDNSKVAKWTSESDNKDKYTRKLQVAYDVDSESLLPTLISKTTRLPKIVRVELVGAKKIKVPFNTNKLITSETEKELPNVGLSDESSDIGYENHSQDELIKTPEIYQNDFKNKDISSVGDVNNIAESNNREILNSLEKKTDEKNHISCEDDQFDLINNIPTFTPSIVRTSKSKPISVWIRVSPLLATTLAIICVALILSASLSVSVFSSEFESHIVFKLENIFEILSS